LRRGIFTRGYIYKMLYLQEINCHRPCLAGLDAQFTAAALFGIENDFHPAFPDYCNEKSIIKPLNIDI